ncbi:MAG TPA: DUF935 family protein [Thermoanaerobaculia bacterium]|nr:DUF935 family protein [Thermoanaerobaculia bacterium]
MVEAVATVPRPSNLLGRELADEASAERLARFRFLDQEDPHPSEILLKRSRPGDRLGELYRYMLRSDGNLKGLWAKRRRAVLALPRLLQPADSTAAAVEAAELVRFALGHIEQFQDSLRRVLDAVLFGVSITEVLWAQAAEGPFAGALVPRALRDRPMWRFAFREGQLHIRRPPARLEPAPPLRFLVGRYGSHDGPWGEGELDGLYWPWYISKNGLQFWATFIDKYAQPTPYTRYKPHASDKSINRERLEQALAIVKAIQTESGFALPEGLEVALLEASRSGGVSYSDFLAFFRMMYALVLLGEVDTSGFGEGPGSFAKSKISNDVRVETIAEDAKWLSSLLNETLVRWIVDLNLPPGTPRPRFEIDTKEAEDRALRQAGMERVLAAGQPVPRADFYALHQVREPVEGEPVVERVTPPDSAAPGAPALAAPPAGTVLLSAESRELDQIASEAERRDVALQQVAEYFRAQTLAYWQEHQREVAAAFGDGSRPGAALESAFAAILPLAQLHARRLQAAMVHAAGLTLWQIEQDGLDITLASPPAWRGADTPDSALDFWSRVLRIGKGLFRQLVDELRRLAFAVAGVDEALLLEQTHGLLGRAQAEGWSRGRFREELARAYESAGRTPTSDWHADLILTNNTRQTAGVIFFRNTVGNPEAHRLLPYLTFITLGDDKVRERPAHNHRVVHRKVFAIGHPFWLSWFFPAGHGCRCLVGSINLARARRMQLTGSEPTGPWPQAPDGSGLALPDPGFRGVPSLETGSQRALARLEEALERARAAGNSALLEALQILQQTFGRV